VGELVIIVQPVNNLETIQKVFRDSFRSLDLSLPELSSIFSYNPDIPGDMDEKKAEMERSYRETYEDLAKKGLLSAGPVPRSLLINAHLAWHKCLAYPARGGAGCNHRWWGLHRFLRWEVSSGLERLS
jgi:hypothetical protein